MKGSNSQRFEAVCIASGSSLTIEDCEKVRIWREERDSRRVFVVNTTYQIASWADYLYANDKAWWNLHKEQVATEFKGECLAPMQLEGTTMVTKIVNNSGAATLFTASLMGAERIIMLGYDCKKTNGMAHWHGDHPKPLGNAVSMDKWAALFLKVSAHIKCQVINASRETALDMFERANLEDALN
jgi:hypothetical protein